MACRDKKTKIHPKNIEDRQQFVRINGWMKPLHWFQFIAWGILLLFALIYFGLCAIALENGWKPAAYVCVGVVYLVHIVVHIVAITVNPADDNSKTRIQENHEVPSFDRSQHVHVIENEYCHLCEVHVNQGSKHCRTCNKCVAEFDHHCLWLNNCVGRRNYKYFFGSISTALLGIILMLIVSMYVFIQAIQNFQGLDSAVWWNNLSVSWILFEGIIGIFILLAFIAMFLLGQLLIFHFKLFHLKMTTYEYIVKQRDQKENKVKVSTVKLQPLHSNGEPTKSCAGSPDYGETTVIDSTEFVDFPKHNLIKKTNPTPERTINTKDYLTPKKTFHLNKAYNIDSENHHHNDNNSSNERSRSVTPQSRTPSSLGELEDGLPENKPSEINKEWNLTAVVKTSHQEVGDKTSVVTKANEISPEVKIEKPKRKKRKASKKSMMKHTEDGKPMPLPILHESPDALRASADSNIRQGPYSTNRLPPLRSSVEWASSSEDLSSSVVTARKLPPLSNSSSMNSLASYAGSGFEQPLRK